LQVQASSPPADAVTIQVNGSALGSIVTSPLTLAPGFSNTLQDYVVRCHIGVNQITLRLSAVSGGSIQVGSQSGSTLSVTKAVVENMPIVVEAPDPANSANRIKYWIRCLPHDFPVMSISRPGNPSPGWYTTGNIQPVNSAGSANYAMVLDNHATPVWYQKVPSGPDDIKLLPNDTLVWAPNLGPTIGANPNDGFHLLNLDTMTTQVFKAANGLPTDMHEFHQTSTGERWLIATPVNNSIDPNLPQFPNSHSIVDCVIQELDSAGNLLWSWKASDHIAISESTLASLPPTMTAVDVFHCNSVDVSPDDATASDVLVSMRNTSAVYDISKANYGVKWKLGGNSNVGKDGEPVLALQNDPEGSISGQHDARFQPNGHVSLYDDHTAGGGAARGIEYVINTTARTATFSWQYAEPHGWNALATGSFRRYGNDNLVNWGFRNASSPPFGGSGFTEVNDSKQVLLDVSFPNGEPEYRTVKFPLSTISADLLRQTAGLPRPTCTVPTTSGTAPTPPTPTSFYFAEGYTGGGFWECLSLLMPNAGGTALIDYYTPSGHTTGTVPLTAGVVSVVNVNQAVGINQQVSVRVTLPGPGIVERQLYFNGGGWRGATDKVGVTSPNTEWDFAEGSTLDNFSEYLTLENPNSSAVTVDLKYATDLGAHPTKTLTLPAATRTTVEVFNGDTVTDVINCVANGPGASCGVGRPVGGVSVQVLSRSLPIVAERPFYVNNYSFGSGPIADGHDEFGANAPDKSWSFAEGNTQPGFNEYLTLQNPGTVPANATIQYQDDAGDVMTRTFQVGAHTRSTVEVFKGTTASSVTGCIPSGPGASCGVGAGVGGLAAQVTSDQPIVVERPLYLVHTFAAGTVAGAHVAMGQTGSGATLYGFSAVSTLPSDFDYLTLLNPSASNPATLTITYYTSGGPVVKTVTVPAHTRHTTEIFNSAEGAGPSPDPVGVVISSDQPILVEKPAYSTGTDTYGATDARAYSPASF
jgi:hypothetical protein